MPRHNREEVEAPGQDSFLDVVANLVGMLIILVMVVGAQTKRGLIAHETARQTATPISAAQPDLAGAQAAAASVEQSIGELQQKIRRQNLEVAFREQERNKVQLLVTIAEQRLAEHRNGLAGSEQTRYDLQEQ